jgi:superfamily II DNA/RNA helicase
MTSYAWEQNAKPQKKGKKTGTVVFHPNEHVSTSFDDCKLLSAETTTVLQDKMKFTELLPSQAQSFRAIHQARDVILHSRTGSGKTLAYVLPIVERRLNDPEETQSTAALPFLIVLVFSNELAVQTQSVIKQVYGDRVNVAVAGYDKIDAGDKSIGVVIGTLAAVDHLVRGTVTDEEDASASDSDDDSDADEDEVAARKAYELQKKKSAAAGTRNKRRRLETVSRLDLSGVRAIAIDEVDVTIGPKFSTTGRRMKNFLKVIRRANGSLSSDLIGTDFRAHHYVLCGATIPNWVIKAGFLGAKKYYFQLVDAGTNKLPSQLKCYAVDAPKGDKAQRFDRIGQVLAAGHKRTVVFTTNHKIDALEEHLAAQAAAGGPLAKAKKSEGLVLRSLSVSKDEGQRIQCIEDFNNGIANVLLCTDSAARGLDFVAVDVVVMESMPAHASASESFVHRAGRTARVGSAGACVVVCDLAEDATMLKKLESVIHVLFNPFPGLSATATTSKVASFKLRIRNPFGGKGKTQALTPLQAIQKCLDSEDAAAATKSVKEVSAEEVSFSVPVAASDRVRKAMWKYDLTIV